MRKYGRAIKLLLNPIMILAAMMALTACGSKAPEGYYLLTGIEEGKTSAFEDELEDYGLDDSYLVIDEGEGQLVLFDVPIPFSMDPDVRAITMEESSQKGQIPYEMDKDTLTLYDDHITMFFEKSSKKSPKMLPEVDLSKAYVKEGASSGGFDLGGGSDDGGDSGSGSGLNDVLGSDLFEGSGGSSPGRDFWEGGWYGWWEIDTTSDDEMWYQFEDQAFDILAEIDIDDDYEKGTMTLWDKDLDKDNPISKVDISTRAGLSDLGEIMTEGGYFLDSPIEHADWIIEPKDYDEYSDYIEIYCRYNGGDGDSRMSYTIHLKKWGADWSDYPQKPPQYDWYKDMIDSGAGMADTLPE